MQGLKDTETEIKLNGVEANIISDLLMTLASSLEVDQNYRILQHRLTKSVETST